MTKRPPKSTIYCENCHKRKPYTGSKLLDLATPSNPLVSPIAVCESCLIALGYKKPKRFIVRRGKGEDIGKPPFILAKPFSP